MLKALPETPGEIRSRPARRTMRAGCRHSVRVVQLTSVHTPQDVRIFEKECRSLARAGYDVTLIAPTPQDRRVDGVLIKGVPPTEKRSVRMTATVWRVYREASRLGADIYHFHDPELIPAALLLRAQGKSVIYDVHEDLGRDIQGKPYVPVALRVPLAWLTDRFENIAARLFTGLLTATDGIGERFEKLNKRVMVLNNFPVLKDIEPVSSIPWSRRPVSVAYVGGITADRGIREITRAMGMLPDQLGAQLELAGPFSPASLENEVSRLPGWVRVNNRGVLRRSGVADLLGKVRAGLLVFHPEPNNLRAQPNKLFEYMAAGIPVVASNFPLWRSIIDEVGCGVLVDPLDAKDIARAVEYLLTHAEEAELMGRRGRDATEKHFNWDHEERKLLRFYRGLFESPCAE